MKQEPNTRIRTLARAIDKRPLPGHQTGSAVTMRQGVVQTNGWNQAAATVTVLLGGATTPVALPFMGYPPGDGEVAWIYCVDDMYIVIGSTIQPGWGGPW